MNLIRTSKARFVFHVGRREKDLLLAILKLYPRIPPAHHRLTKASKPDVSSQQLLDEALAEQRAENQKQLAALISHPARWTAHEGGWRLALKPTEMEWLLQVLNDVRIGSWVLLGSPEDRIDMLNEETAPHVWAMEVAGIFEMALLHALEGGAEH